MPRTAVSGPVVLVSADGAESAPSAVPLTIDTAAPPATSGAGDSLGIDVEVQGNRVFYGAERMAQVSYLVRGTQPANVAVELIRLSDGVAITRWEPGLVPPETPQTVTWDGTAGGKVQRDGRYAFRVFAQSASGATASSSQVPAATTPRRRRPGHLPVPAQHLPDPRRPHDGHRRRGLRRRPRAPGPGHLRQVRDAAGRGRAPASSSSSTTTRAPATTSSSTATTTGYDYAYMHLRDAALVDQGDHVYTGQPIGFVGDTGRAEGCHLHFEVWTGPGLVQRRPRDRPAAAAAGLGQDFVVPCRSVGVRGLTGERQRRLGRGGFRRGCADWV